MLHLEELPIVASHESAIRGVKVSHDGQTMATADVDRVIGIWKKEDGEWFQTHLLDLRHFSDRFRALDLIRDLEFDQLGKTLFVASGETLRAIDVATGRELWQNQANPDWAFMITTPLAIAVSQSDRLACAYADGTVEVYEANMDNPSFRWQDNDGPAYIGFLHDGNRLIGTDRYSGCIWDSFYGARLKQLQLPAKIFQMAVSPTENRIAVRTLNEVYVYDVDQDRWMGGAKAKAGLPALAFSSNGKFFVSLDASGYSWFDHDGNFLGRVQHAGQGHLLTAVFSQTELLLSGSDGTVWRQPAIPSYSTIPEVDPLPDSSDSSDGLE